MTDILIQSGETLLKEPLVVEPDTSGSFDFMQILRFLFYVLVVMKLIELSFLRRKKHSLKERVYRKFLFAHQELLKQFTEEDKANMQHTLNNTIKNATVDYRNTRNKQTKGRKHVNFSIEKNSYYDPKQWKNDYEDEDMYLDVEDNHGNMPFEITKEGDMRGKLIEEEFGERQNLQKINEKEEQIEIQSSKLTQDTQIPSEVGVSEVSQVSDLPVESKGSLLSNKDSSLPNKDSLSNQGEEGDEAKLSLRQISTKKQQ